MSGVGWVTMEILSSEIYHHGNVKVEQRFGDLYPTIKMVLPRLV